MSSLSDDSSSGCSNPTAPSAPPPTRINPPRQNFFCPIENCQQQEEFPSYEKLLEHYREHNQSQPYACNYTEACVYKSATRSDIVSHCISVHGQSSNTKYPLQHVNVDYTLLEQEEQILLQLIKLTQKNVGALAEEEDSSVDSEASPLSATTTCTLTSKQENRKKKDSLLAASSTTSRCALKRKVTEGKEPQEVIKKGKKKDARQHSSPEEAKQKSIDLGEMSSSSEDEKEVGIGGQHRSFPCRYVDCPQPPFETLDQLKKHDRVHTGIKPYQCAYQSCLFASNQKRTTLLHIGEHLKAGEFLNVDEKLLEEEDRQLRNWLKQNESKLVSQSMDAMVADLPKQDVQPEASGQKRVYHCDFSECKASFPRQIEMFRHRTSHLGGHTFRCTFPTSTEACPYQTHDMAKAICHVRLMHFLLPPHEREQRKLNIKDDRNAKQFIRAEECAQKCQPKTNFKLDIPVMACYFNKKGHCKSFLTCARARCNHEQIHLVKVPFVCAICDPSRGSYSEHKWGKVYRHIRTEHLGLPAIRPEKEENKPDEAREMIIVNEYTFP